MGCYYASHTPQIWSALTYKACLCKKNIMYINIIASDNNFPPKKVQVIITNNTKKRYLSNYKIHIHICQKPTMGLEKPNFESLRTIWILAKHTLTNMQSSKRTDSKLEIQRKKRTGRDKDSLKNMEKKLIIIRTETSVKLYLMNSFSRNLEKIICFMNSIFEWA